jgi:hypothetical protein
VSEHLRSGRPEKLISRADLARLGDVTAAAITSLFRRRLSAAIRGTLVDANHPDVVAWLAERRRKGAKPRPKAADSKLEIMHRARLRAERRDRERAEAAKLSPLNDAFPPKPEPPKPTPVDPRNPRGAGRKPRLEPRAPASPPPNSGIPAPTLDESGFAEEIFDLTVKQVAERWGTDRAYVAWLEAYVKQQRGCGDWLKNQQTRGSLIERELVHRQVFTHIASLQHRILTDATRTIVARIYPMAKSGDSPEQAEREVRALLSKQLKSLRSTVLRALKPKPAKPDIPE